MEKLQGERKNNPINRKPLASELKPNSKGTFYSEDVGEIVTSPFT